MRNSPALAIIPNLVDKGAIIRAHDPQGTEEAKNLLLEKVRYFDDVYEMLTGADACVLLTEWNEYRGLDMERIRELTAGNVFVDLRNVYERARMSSLDFTYSCIAR